MAQTGCHLAGLSKTGGKSVLRARVLAVKRLLEILGKSGGGGDIQNKDNDFSPKSFSLVKQKGLV